MEEPQQTYKEFIEQIINTRGQYNCGDSYHERHHIAPKCLGGTNDPDNMIDLYPEEHYTAHKLLALENPHSRGLQFAWFMMCNAVTSSQERYKCSAEEYAQAKKSFSKSQSGENNPMYGVTGEKNPRYGTKHTQESKDKMSKNHKKLFGADNYFYGCHHTEDTKKKMKENHYDCSGKNNSFYGKHHTKETIEKISIPVVCVETNIRYIGVTEAEKNTGIDKSSITKCCRGKLKTAGGYHWQYADDKKETE